MGAAASGIVGIIGSIRIVRPLAAALIAVAPLFLLLASLAHAPTHRLVTNRRLLLPMSICT